MTWLRIDNKREKMAAVITKCGLLKLLEITRPRLYRLTVLAYHRVLDIDPDKYLFDEDNVSASTEDFYRQMDYVKRNFDVISFGDLKGFIENGQMPKWPLIITFDDGYEDNYYNAYPILKHYNLPATIFLTTGYIDDSEPFWFEKVAYWIKSSNRESIRLGAQPGVDLPLNMLKGKTLSIVLKTLKAADEDSHQRMMTQMEEQIGAILEDGHLVQVLSWDEIREMHSGGIEFGSHSVSHLNPAKISRKRLRDEIYYSKAKIEKELCTPVLTFAYPFGGRDAFSNDVKEMLREAGYSFGISYINGINPLSRFDNFAINRIHIERDMDINLFKVALHLPRIYPGSQ